MEVLGNALMDEKSILNGQIRPGEEEGRHIASCPQDIVSGTRVLDSSSNLLLFCVDASFGAGGVPSVQFRARDHDRASYECPFAVAVDVARGADGPAVGFASGLGCGGGVLVGESQGWAVHVKGAVQLGERKCDEPVRGDAGLWVGIL